MERRECQSCKGSRRDNLYHREPCHTCRGTGYFEEPDVQAIIRAIVGRKGLRSNPSGLDDRSYYVWRMARFHGGRDVTMPVVASLRVHGDPFVPELDAIASAIARKIYGTDMAAAYRWGQALGFDLPASQALPATAYRGGPVVLAGDKPDTEWPELR